MNQVIIYLWNIKDDIVKTEVRKHMRISKLGKRFQVRKYLRRFAHERVSKRSKDLSNSFSDENFKIVWDENKYLFINRNEVKNRYKKFIRIFNSFSYPLTIYRGLNVDSIKNVNKDHPGIFWTYNYQEVIPFKVILSAKVNKQNIDWEATRKRFIENDNFEKEIIIRNDFKIKIDSISYSRR